VHAIFEHHRDRLQQVHEAVRLAGGSTTTWDVATQIAWSRGWDETRGFLRRLALAETGAHLRWLSRRGLLEEAAGRPTAWSVNATRSVSERIQEELVREYGIAG
jgi:hypothetical protein